MKKVIIITGTPQSGKKTHAEILSKKLDYKLLSFDDIINKDSNSLSKIENKIQTIFKYGNIIPDEYFNFLIKESIINLQQKGIVLLGLPQNIAQAKSLDNYLFLKKNEKPIVIFLSANIENTIFRLGNDNEKFEKVYNEFENKHKKIIDYYKDAVCFDTSKDDISIINDKIVDTLKM